MTINEAIRDGITAITQEPWKSHNPYCRMELPQGTPRGIWAKIVDPCGNVACGDGPEDGISVLLVANRNGLVVHPTADPYIDEWEKWERPSDYEEMVSRMLKERKELNHGK